jgi:hypothetical protein
MDAMERAKNNDSGIQSLSGFSYQIRVFVYYMSKMVSKSQIEFETLEDVVVRNYNVDTFLDENCDAFRSLLKKESDSDAIQVKRTTISNETRQKILYNWLLLESTEVNIANYILFTDDAYENTDNLFDITSDTLFGIVTKSNKKSNALVSKVKTIWENDFEKFKEAYEKIKGKYSFISEKSLDDKIMNGFELIFRKEGVSELTYALRIKELIRMIVGDIITTIDKKIPYICTYKTMMEKVEDICDRVKNNYFEPDFITFKKTKKINLNNQIIANSREYKQLFSCNLSDKRIEEHLIYQQYYESIRYLYLVDNNLNIVENIESTTYDNFCNAKEYLEQNDKDTPGNRLSKTKEKDNYYAPKNQTRVGSCIHLTKETTEDNLEISWEDES